MYKSKKGDVTLNMKSSIYHNDCSLADKSCIFNFNNISLSNI